MMEYILWVGFITIIGLICLLLIVTCDEKHGLKFEKRIIAAVVFYILVAAGVVWSRHDAAKGALLCFFFAYLVIASYCDCCTQLVYRFLYVPAIFAGIGYMLLEGLTLERIVSMGIYYSLMLFLFQKYFGRADSAAFMITALFYHYGSVSILLWGMFHMLLSVVLVFIIKHKKIDFRKGTVEPTAFMPYISVTAPVFIYLSSYMA